MTAQIRFAYCHNIKTASAAQVTAQRMNTMAHIGLKMNPDGTLVRCRLPASSPHVTYTQEEQAVNDRIAAARPTCTPEQELCEVCGRAITRGFGRCVRHQDAQWVAERRNR